MQTAELKEYLGMLVEMEKESYTQNQMMARLESEIGSLGYPQRIWKPEKKELRDNYNATLNFAMLTGLSFFFGTIFHVLTYLAFFFFLLAMCSFFIAGGRERKNDDEYEQQLKDYKKAMKRDDKRVQKELRYKVLLQSELENLRAAHAKTQKHLQSVYDCNIIHPKYRGLIPVCSLYGYFDTGVCTQLEGHEGAYNKYDNESRLDYIICKMDEVIKHLEDIKSNQYQLYSAIQESGEKCDRLIANTSQMMNQLNGIQAQGTELNARIAQLQTTSDLTLYETACNRQELAYLNRVTEWGY